MLNKHTTTARHNEYNRAWYNAISARATSAVILGDKGDGSPQARARAKQRYAIFNDGHVPDIIEKNAAHNGNHILYESKVYNELKQTTNYGNGTAAGGGSPSTSAGDTVAFGCTEEYLLQLIFGNKQRGSPSDPTFRHDTGIGYVAASLGHYDDAMTVKQNTVLALIASPLGGVTRFTDCTLSRMAKEASGTGRDGAVYGEFSTHSFYLHHAGAISMALVKMTAEAIEASINAKLSILHRKAPAAL